MATNSATVTATSTAQDILAANAARASLLVRNQGGGDVYIRFDGTAAGNADSLMLKPFEAYMMPAGAPLEAVSVVCPDGTSVVHAIET